MQDPQTPHNHADPPQFTNRLAQEKSPYLLQHAHNPVDWFPWGEEAMEKARHQDKPIFLSVGYSACHWCHVMERESFENEAVAALLNEHFICVKVDREERPDIDEIYMTAVQMMTGQGGWPMSVFMTPDGRPFFGGTYFPPEGRGGRIGFSSLITQLSDAYQNRRQEVEEVGENVAAQIRPLTRPKPPTAEGALDAVALRHLAVDELVERFDARRGGFGNAPKFPPHHALRLLCRAVEEGETEAKRLLTVTLEKMALGGIYDHIGGGFHRYSTDADWLLPHFEKMLYDNAMLARVYADAYRITGREAFARIARETCDWVIRDLTDDGGGFHSALDADSEGEEGKFYLWTPEEIETILGPEIAPRFCALYHIVPGGNFRDEATGHVSGANIPYLGVGASGAEIPDNLPPDILAAREKLRTARDKRIWPAKDDKVLASWNGLMIGALAFCGKILDEGRYLEAARRAANFCLGAMRPHALLLHRYAKGEAAIPAFLDDYAYLADGLLDLADAHQGTESEPAWQGEARVLTDTLLTGFWDDEDGGFFFTGEHHETLIARSKEMFDGAMPSPNGVAARVLVRLSALEGGEKYAKAAYALLNDYRGLLQRAPSGTHTLILAAQDALPGISDATAAQNPVTLTADAPLLTLRPGESANAVFTLRIAPDYHINARIPTHENLIPTLATFATDAPAALGPVGYPPAAVWSGGGEEISVYHGDARFTLPIAAAPDAAPGLFTVTLTVRYQPCNETACLAPDEQRVSLSLQIGGEGIQSAR